MPTPVHCCGFECGTTRVDDSGGTSTHLFLSGTGSISTTTVRTGSRSGRLNPTAATAYFASGQFTGSNYYVARAYVRFATLPSATTEILTATYVPEAGAYFNASDNKIYAGSGTASLGASGVSVTTGVWYRIDVGVDAHTNPWTIDVQVDGVACGRQTRAASATTYTFANVGFRATACTADMFIDDWITSQTIADYPIGAGYVNHFVPTSDGTHNIAGTGDFQRTLTGTDILNATTTAFQLVDEVPLEATVTDWINMVAPPNATDYVECVFGPAPGISTPTTAPRAVEVICGINQAGTGTGNMEIRLNDNGTTNTFYTATGVAGVAVASGQIFKRKHYPTAPTGGAWTVVSGAGNFNNLKIRFGSPAAVDANPDQYFGCAMVEAEFQEVANNFLYFLPAKFLRKRLTQSQRQRRL